MTVNELAKRYPAASEYLTQIYLIIRDYAYCNNHRLADLIGVSPSAVSQAVGRLKRLGLTDQDKYGMITLLETGRILAEKILKRHYLLEYLMVRQLDFPWELADKEAERLQDKVSEDFITHLDKRLDHQMVCPHGNPFPCNPHLAEILKAEPLSKAAVGDTIEIVRITEEGEREPGLLHTCYETGAMPGSIYTLIKIDGDQLILADMTSDSKIYIPLHYAEYMRVKSIQSRTVVS